MSSVQLCGFSGRNAAASAVENDIGYIGDRVFSFSDIPDCVPGLFEGCKGFSGGIGASYNGAESLQLIFSKRAFFQCGGEKQIRPHFTSCLLNPFTDDAPSFQQPIFRLFEICELEKMF
jgi:hypothetical protein